MAIALDTSANLGTTAGTTLTVAYTCSGSNRLLVVGVDENQTAGGQKVTGVTYAGVSMTEISGSPFAVAGRWFHLLYLVNPASGSNNIVITATAGGDYVEGVAASYTGVGQTGQPDVVGTNTASGATSISKSVTTVADNDWLVGVRRGSPTSLAGQAGTTLRVNPGNSISFLDSNGAKTPPGSYSLGVTWSGAGDSGIMVAAFSPAIVTYTLTMGQGSYSLTGQAVSLFRSFNYSLALAFGTFTLTGYAASFALRTYTRFVNLVKNAITPTNSTKQANATFSNQSKNSITPTNQAKN